MSDYYVSFDTANDLYWVGERGRSCLADNPLIRPARATSLPEEQANWLAIRLARDYRSEARVYRGAALVRTYRFCGECGGVHFAVCPDGEEVAK